MSIIARIATTRHQKSQVAAKAKRTTVRPFGFGIAPASKPAPMTDDGSVTPNAFRPTHSNVSMADRHEWARLSAQIDADRQMMVEFRESEERAEAIERITYEDLSWAERELNEARRFESYGW